MTFRDWTLPVSEAPESFIFWTGLFTLSSALRRHVKIPKFRIDENGKKRGVLGSWEASPNLYILFIAQAGRARKSTTANYSETLLDEIPNITKAPELITKEELLKQLARSADASMSILAPEFGEFMVKSGVDMYGFLTNAYDGKKKLGSATIGRAHDFAEKPCINLLGATTPEWVAANMPESIIGGGFASRAIFVFEERVRTREIIYDEVDYDALEDMRLDLLADLAHISEQIHGDFQFTTEAQQYLRTWYKENSSEDGVKDYKLQGYFERKPAHILKIAQILHVAYSDELVITLSDIQQAIAIVEMVEKKLPETFQSIGKNPFNTEVKRILNFVKQNGRVYETQLKREFRHAALPKQLDELIMDLCSSGDLILKVDPMKLDGQRRFFELGKVIVLASRRAPEVGQADHYPEPSPSPLSDH